MSNGGRPSVGDGSGVANTGGLPRAWILTCLGSWEPTFLGRWVDFWALLAGVVGAGGAVKSCRSVPGFDSDVWFVSAIPANGLAGFVMRRPPFGRGSAYGRW